MTGEELLAHLQQMTPEERAAPIMVHVEDEDTGDEMMGEPVHLNHEFDCDDNGILRLHVSTEPDTATDMQSGEPSNG